MMRRSITCVIIFFLTAIYFLADGSSLPAAVNSHVSQTSVVSVKVKEDKCVKPFSKIKKVKFKVRYKASEVKFTLNAFYICRLTPALIAKAVPANHQYHLATGFHFTKKLRGPPTVI